MKLADKPCYPEINGTQNYTNGSGFEVQYTGGLTFRERLIVALAGNSESFYTTIEEDSIAVDRQKTAAKIIEIADAIIKQLEEENTNEPK